VDLVRFGLIIRALRRRRGWRQLDLALAAGVSQTLVSMIERGHADQVLLAHVMTVVAALEARVVIDIRWRGGELDRLLDRNHAELASSIGRLLAGHGWEVRFEVTYAVYGANGSLDALAWHAATGTLLIIEIKTEVTSAEATIRKLDEKVRLGAQIAMERFGWRARSVSRLLVVEDTTTARRRVATAAGLFAAAFPFRGVAARRWLPSPDGPVSALLFLPSSSPSAAMSRRGGRHRVRRGRDGQAPTDPSVRTDERGPSEAPSGTTILTGRT
jgi:transcriptional regulator with XRE-family HTH domain